MLNVSVNREKGNAKSYKHRRSYRMTLSSGENRRRIKLLQRIALASLIFLFLPWTQNVRSPGFVTAFKPEHRPQTVHSVIAGQIEHWYVGEGDYVEKGDTVLLITEIVDDFFDPKLLDRTRQQVEARTMSAKSYGQKANALEQQIKALRANNILRREQAENRLRMAELQVISDSIRFTQAKVNYDVGMEQLRRAENLYRDGLRSLVDLETRQLRFEEVKASLISLENNLLASINEKLAAQIELNAIDNDFMDKVAKAQSEIYASLSSQFDAEATATKLENQYSNYEMRTRFRHILAPQNGYITRAIQVGIGETIKAGAEIISIAPADAQLAVEMMVEPYDLPLMLVGNKVRFLFDGWPAIVFSGWPALTNGTFGGVVAAIDKFPAIDGQHYRILVVEDPDEKPWPEALNIGSGADGIALLNDVPIWYEIWRQMNGFPPDYYSKQEKRAQKSKRK